MYDRRFPDAPGLSARDRRKGRQLACQSRRSRTAGSGRSHHRGRHAPADPAGRRAALVDPLTHDMSSSCSPPTPARRLPAGAVRDDHAADGQVEQAYSMSNIGNAATASGSSSSSGPPTGRPPRSLFDKLEVRATVVLDGLQPRLPAGPGGNQNIACVMLAGQARRDGLDRARGRGAAQRRRLDRTPYHLFCEPDQAGHPFPGRWRRGAPRLGALRPPPSPTRDRTPWPGRISGVPPTPFSTGSPGLTDFTYYAAGAPAMTDALAPRAGARRRSRGGPAPFRPILLRGLSTWRT
ncbi:hypothetical protein HBB16_10555 [Pseudonocardia sp. MCCB 268]|nr:hypothetical protein [Pseudonocardia cytotoxica]